MTSYAAAPLQFRRRIFVIAARTPIRAVLADALLRHRKGRSSRAGSCPAATWTLREALGFKGEGVMLYTIAVILLILWLLGFVSGYTIGAFIHVLLVVAIVLFLVGLLSGRRVV
jgi:hypothetical protein